MIHFLDNQSANKNTPSKKIHADHVETWQVHQKPNIYPKKNNCDAVHGHMQKYSSGKNGDVVGLGLPFSTESEKESE